VVKRKILSPRREWNPRTSLLQDTSLMAAPPVLPTAYNNADLVTRSTNHAVCTVNVSAIRRLPSCWYLTTLSA